MVVGDTILNHDGDILTHNSGVVGVLRRVTGGTGKGDRCSVTQ